MKKILVVFLVSVLFACGNGSAGNSSPAEKKMSNELLGDFSHRDMVTVVYKSSVNPPLRADVFIPKNYGEVEKHPVLITYHGGAWTSGMSRFMHIQCWIFAEKGFIAISPEYRTVNSHSATPLEGIADAKSIVRWVRQNAAVLHADPDRIVVSGASAGGHLAACTAMINGYDDPLEISPVPNALILYCPALDTDDNGYKSLLKKPAEVRLSSPYHNIRANLPPVLILQGDKDEIVPYEKNVSFAKKMKDAGNVCEIFIMKDHTHNMYDQNFVDTKDLCFEFLAKIGIIKN